MRNHPFTAFPAQAAERLFCPLCQQTELRLRRLQILDPEGQVRAEGVKALTAVHGTALYEQLLEMEEDVGELFENFSALYCAEDVSGLYLYLCLMYGLIEEEVPPPLQWLASHKTALLEYGGAWLDLVLEYMTEDGLLEEDGEAEDEEQEQEAEHDTA